jgi:hypothetical protein
MSEGLLYKLTGSFDFREGDFIYGEVILCTIKERRFRVKESVIRRTFCTRDRDITRRI